MSNKKKNNFYSHKLQLNTDSLAYAPDEELRSLHDSLQRERDMTLREDHDSRSVEDSISYVQRELSIREKRRCAHASYLKLSGYVDLAEETQQHAVPAPADQNN